ncbi:ImmA/IrrE family metallo-endopeptidase [Bradyrhizobium sp. 2TAF36]|uniref:ImmA/IrrE family metallo-endopeptidase n=1 Tax=Bradyrhizobium sp. 2TAF36 TaxID=3233016 RepID=UPI003F8DF486
MLDELDIATKAREFIRHCGPLALPVSVHAYAAQIGGTVVEDTLGEKEDAWSFREPRGKLHICVNCAQTARRRRFSVCHEVAHVVLGIEPDHSAPSWSYARRPPGEIACDDFAAELLLPYKLFKPRVDSADMGLSAIGALADEFDASLQSTGSRFATFSRELCAFLVSEGGKISYSARSPRLREAKGWIRRGMPVPADSYSARVRAGEGLSSPEEAEPDQWFEDWQRDGVLIEDTLHLGQWDQTLTLLWFDDDELAPPAPERKQWDEDSFRLRELDGVLPWPGRSKRK